MGYEGELGVMKRGERETEKEWCGEKERSGRNNSQKEKVFSRYSLQLHQIAP